MTKRLLPWVVCLVFVGCAGPDVAKNDKGSIAADSVEAALLSRKDDFRRCYADEVEDRSPAPSGRVGTKFTVELNGKVRKASVASTTLLLPKTEACILKVIKQIQFPLPKAGVEVVEYPFQFNSP